MNAAHLCGALREGLPDLYDCAPAPRDGVRVRTPMLYPDGGVVDIFVLEREGTYTLTDFGETLGWLRMQTVNPRRTPRQQRLIDDVCRTLDVNLSRGQLVLRSSTAAELGESVTRLAQAQRSRVSDIWFTLRSRSLESATEEVGEWLTEKEISYQQGVRRRGRSGRETGTSTSRRSPTSTPRWYFFLSTGSRSAARHITEHVLAGCYDLSHLKISHPGISFVSLFDDTSDVWRPEDFRIVDDVSEVAPMVPARRIRDDSQGRLIIPPRSV